MAAKKNFDTINTEKQETGIETGTVYNEIERGKSTYKSQPTASLEEQESRKASGKTQGRKGCHQERINTAFTSENLDFVKVVSRVKGVSMTTFINYCIEQYRNEHPDIYNAAKAVIAMTEKDVENTTTDSKPEAKDADTN